MSGVADSVRKVGASLRDSGSQNKIVDSAIEYGDQLAQRIERASGYLEQKDLRDILRDTQQFARQNPAMFLLGALTVGFAAGRFLKSSSPNQSLIVRPSNSIDEQEGSGDAMNDSGDFDAVRTANATGGAGFGNQT